MEAIIIESAKSLGHHKELDLFIIEEAVEAVVLKRRTKLNWKQFQQVVASVTTLLKLSGRKVL